jgi:hypothetical protein
MKDSVIWNTWIACCRNSSENEAPKEAVKHADFPGRHIKLKDELPLQQYAARVFSVFICGLLACDYKI